jgi:hypothetical protein
VTAAVIEKLDLTTDLKDITMFDTNPAPREAAAS